METKRVYDLEDLYERVKEDDFPLTEEEFESKLNELAVKGKILIKTNLDDCYEYEIAPGIELSDIDDDIESKILKVMYENPKAFFMLGNTQNGKSRKIGGVVYEGTKEKDVKPVFFIVVDNDQALSDQFVSSLRGQPIKLFRLSGDKGDLFEPIQTYIDAYHHDVRGRYPMPVIVLLSNEIQNAKMVKLVAHIDEMVTEDLWKLRYGIIWDECDVTYPRLRDAPVMDWTIRYFMTEKTAGLYKVGWISATEGELIDEDSPYPECRNAQIYPFVPDPETQPYYKSMHSPDAVVHHVPFEKKPGYNNYAAKVMTGNRVHFTSPIGETYRKIIVNSDRSQKKMDEFAKWCVSDMEMNCIVFNGEKGTSLKLYMSGQPVETFPTKGYTLNQLLFYVYKKRMLHSKPLVVIGNRKVNRGLTFSYCPRDGKESVIKGKLGNLVTCDREGLVFTDMILGRIENVSRAVQKAGRLCGIIGDSPQYTGSIHFWTDKYTSDKIIAHNRMVDAANQLEYVPIAEAVSEGRDNTHENYTTEDFLVYDCWETVKTVCKLFDYKARKSTATDSRGFLITSTTEKSKAVSMLEAITFAQWVANSRDDTPRTYLPCYKNLDDLSSLHFVVVLRKKGSRAASSTTIDQVKTNYPSIAIPRFGKI